MKSKQDYEKLRHEVMKDDEIKEANKFLEYYRSSWRDKDQRGLFDKWEMMEMYWEGEVNLSESDADPGSNTNIINSSVEGQVALLVEQNIAIQASPVGPSDVPFCEATRIMLEWVKEKNKMKRKLDVHERRREKFGTGIFRVLFDPDFMDGFGLPKIEPRNPAYVFTDPTITDIYNIQEGRFIIETVNKSVQWAKDNGTFIKDRAEAIMPGFHPMESEWIFGEDEGENDDISKDSYLHMYVFIRAKDGDEYKLRMVEMSGCGVILRDTWKEDKDFFANSKYPYFFTPDMYREGTVWGKGTAELLIDQQNQINDFDDQIRINGRLCGNPQKIVDISSGIDVDKITNEPALNIPSQNGTEAVKWLVPPNMPSFIINRRDRIIDVDRQQVTRFSDQQAGIRQKGVDTATEAMALQQSGAAGIDHKKLLLQETLSEVFEYCLDVIKENWTEEQAFKITEKDGEFIWFRGSKLKEVPQLIPADTMYSDMFAKNNPDKEIPSSMENPGVTKEAMFDITVTVGAGMPQNKAFVYTVMKEAMAGQVISPDEFRTYLIKNLGLPIDDKPPQQPMQPGQMPQGPMPSPDVMGMNNAGNPAMPGGVPNV